MTQKNDSPFVLEDDMRQAFSKKQFFLEYQPQLDLHTGTITGFEALIRWQHPKKGLIVPSLFIPLAEKTGMITLLSEYVMNTAFEQIKKWNSLGLGKMTMAINLSAIQLEDKNLQNLVARLIDEKKIEPMLIDLEITESLPMRNTEKAAKILAELSKKTCVTVDDFGTGYSFSHLSTPSIKKLVKKLKIDRSFVQDMDTNKNHEEVVKGFIDFGHKHKIFVVAEGCENKKQLQMLKTFGCDIVQGFYLSKPVPAEKIEEIVKKYNEKSPYLVLAKQKTR